MHAARFDEFALSAPIQRAIKEKGYSSPTPIQRECIPPLLAGRDLLGCAQTGTGKTAAFALPILEHLNGTRAGKRRIRALVLTPTRELAAQVEASFRAYGRHLALRTAVVYGGVPKGKQAKQLRQGADILVATPGRLLDHLNDGLIDLDGLTHFVLDEADRMLDLGFIHDIRKIISVLPKKRQSLFFSATMPKDASNLAESLLQAPIRVEVTPESTPTEQVKQSVLFVDQNQKSTLLGELLRQSDIKRALIFTRTKRGASRLAQQLELYSVLADSIHGDRPQGARTRALKDFRSGKLRVLVATDIAARGIDVDDITHVINYDLPNEPASYIHRIGRTARAGRPGQAISLCSGAERDYLRDIERTMRRSVTVDDSHAYHSEDAAKGLVEGVSPSQKPCGRKVKQPSASAPSRTFQTQGSLGQHGKRPRFRGSVNHRPTSRVPIN